MRQEVVNYSLGNASRETLGHQATSSFVIKSHIFDILDMSRCIEYILPRKTLGHQVIKSNIFDIISRLIVQFVTIIFAKMYKQI